MDKAKVGEWKLFLAPDGKTFDAQVEAVHMNLICKENSQDWKVLYYAGYCEHTNPGPSPIVEIRLIQFVISENAGEIIVFSANPQIPDWDPDGFTLPLPDPDLWDWRGRIFCRGHTFLANGKLLVAGGHKWQPDQNPDDWEGLPYTYTFDPENEQWEIVRDTSLNKSVNMGNGRWYPTVTKLNGDRVVVVSGYKFDEQSITNTHIEVFPDENNKWKTLFDDNNNPVELPFEDLYPGAHLIPYDNNTINVKRGEIFYTGPMKETYRLNVDGEGVPLPFFNEVYDKNEMHHHLNSILLPLKPNSSQMIFMVLAGTGEGEQPLAKVESINLGDQDRIPRWRTLTPLNIPRFNSNTVILPDGKLFVIGGSQTGFRETSVNIPELYDPTGNNGNGVSTMLAAMTYQRLYHSTAILLPDARVLCSGGELPGDFTTGNNNFEVFSPPYLFDGAARPEIQTEINEIFLNTPFALTTDVGIVKIMLISFGSPTHAFDQNQRAIELEIKRDEGESYTYTITPPADDYIAPKGVYMLFALRAGNSPGVLVPSVARIVRLKDN